MVKPRVWVKICSGDGGTPYLYETSASLSDAIGCTWSVFDYCCRGGPPPPSPQFSRVPQPQLTDELTVLSFSFADQEGMLQFSRSATEVMFADHVERTNDKNWKMMMPIGVSGFGVSAVAYEFFHSEVTSVHAVCITYWRHASARHSITIK
jgi:hypothetical protein